MLRRRIDAGLHVPKLRVWNDVGQRGPVRSANGIGIAMQYGVLILSPNQLLREGLKSGLKSSGLDIIGEGESFDVAAANVDLTNSDILTVIAIGTKSYPLPIILREIAEARRRLPGMKVVILSDMLDSEDVICALQGGVNALLSTDAGMDRILHSLDLVLEGQQVFPLLPPDVFNHFESASVAGIRSRTRVTGAPQVVPIAGVDNLVSFTQRASVPSGEVVPLKPSRLAPVTGDATSASLILSDREEQVLRCLVNGHPNKVIARELGIAETTVKVHVKSVLRKVHASNRTQAAIWALNNRPERPGQGADQLSSLPISKLQAG